MWQSCWHLRPRLCGLFVCLFAFFGIFSVDADFPSTVSEKYCSLLLGDKWGWKPTPRPTLDLVVPAHPEVLEAESLKFCEELWKPSSFLHSYSKFLRLSVAGFLETRKNQEHHWGKHVLCQLPCLLGQFLGGMWICKCRWGGRFSPGAAGVASSWGPAREILHPIRMLSFYGWEDTHQFIECGHLRREKRQRVQCYLPHVPFVNHPIPPSSFSSSKFWPFLYGFLSTCANSWNSITWFWKMKVWTIGERARSKRRRKYCCLFLQATEKLVLLCVIKLDMKILFLNRKFQQTSRLQIYLTAHPRPSLKCNLLLAAFIDHLI